MKREEFEAKFNVGDVIIRFGLPVKIISYEGDEDNKFTGKTDGEISGKFSIDARWSLYKEPIKKDLESVFEFYSVRKEDGRVSVTSYLGNDDDFKYLISYYSSLTLYEVITKQEAIDRGLVI
tara:strand:+ start:442 stop:807 length:366 start_codon:yes stop_codon:yes gene_type:complete